MRKLAAVRLVQWYHFADETIPIDGSCLLLGDNGSGKTTVLDAIQLALVADVQQVRFNRAANEQSRRSLYGYVRWKLGSEDAERPGAQRYGRGPCTSYVLLELRDDQDPTRSFVCGVAFEANEAEQQISGRAQFVWPNGDLAQVPCVDGGAVRSLREFRAVLRGEPRANLIPEVGTYRDEVRHRLGALPESFHRLLVRALDFKPLGRVREFVYHYLLDERPVDTEALQQNLEHYKRLEAQARDAEQRIGELDDVCSRGERIAQERRVARGHGHIALRADSEQRKDEARALEARLEATQEDFVRLEEQLRTVKAQAEFLGQERDRVIAALHATETFRQVQEYERDIERTSDQLEVARDADRHAREGLELQRTLLERLLSQEARDLRASQAALFQDEPLLGAADAPEVVQRLTQTLESRGALTGRDLGTWTRRLHSVYQTVGRALFAIEHEHKRIKIDAGELEREKRELETGRLRYSEGAEALLHLLRAKLRGKREPQPVCELIEVPADRWRDAVEGYLDGRRFDVIVDPDDYARALSLYERHKRGYAMPGGREVFIARVGLVDVGRMQSVGTRQEARSLAAQVRTEDPLARTYCDFVLGDLICCDDEQELRRHRRAITDSVLVYEGYVARQRPREAYSRHYIGRAAQIRRLAEIAARLAELADQFVDLARGLEWLKATHTACDKARAGVVTLPALVDQARRVPELGAQLVRLREQLERLDRHAIEALEQERARLDRELAAAHSMRDQTSKQIGEVGRDVTQLSEQSAAAKVSASEAAERLAHDASELEPTWLESIIERYSTERRAREPASIREVFERQKRTIESRVLNLIEQLVAAKTKYVNRHGLSADPIGDGFEAFAQERELWRDSRLPEYRERISEAKAKALEQLTEDIIHRLRESLVDVRRQVDDLNRALKEVRFGSERYEFTLSVAGDHRDFYDLVMEAGRFEADSLFGSKALVPDEARRTLERLFESLIASEATRVKTELEMRADYREYFDYDLKIHNADGSHSLYDRVYQDRSGGETQTPFYVAIFASLHRIYRSHSPDGRPSAGLLLLDEAFSKMDGPRIEATLDFARSLGLQLILATPKERSQLVAPRVDRTLYVHKDPSTGVPIVLDYTKEIREHAR